MLPARTASAASRSGLPSRVAAPATISALTRERESEPIASARKRSARVPAASGPATAVNVSEGVALKALKVLVVVMGVLIVGGTVTLVALLVQRAGGAGGTAWQAVLEQPEGARIAGVAASESGIGIWVQRPDGDRVLVVDPKRGRINGEIRLGR